MPRRHQSRGFGINFPLPVRSVLTTSGRYTVYSVIISWLAAVLGGRYLSFEFGLISGVVVLVLLIVLKGKITDRIEARRMQKNSGEK